MGSHISASNFRCVLCSPIIVATIAVCLLHSPNTASGDEQTANNQVSSREIGAANTHPPDYSTPWFYFFSTIPQALASGYAFIAAVALFKLQSVESTMRQLGLNAADFFHRHDLDLLFRQNVSTAQLASNWAVYLEGLQTLARHPSVSERTKDESDFDRRLEYLEQTISELGHLVTLNQRLYRNLYCGLWLTGAAVLSTIAVLPLGVYVTGRWFLFGWITGTLLVLAPLWAFVQITLTITARTPTSLLDRGDR